MSLPVATPSSSTYGTSSSGASPTNFEPRWENHVHQRIEGPIETFSLPVTDRGTTGGKEQDRVLTLHWREQTAANVDSSLLFDEAYRIWTFRLRINQQFHSIHRRGEDWDGYGSKRPNSLSLAYAEHLLNQLLISVISASRRWIDPFITSDEDGHITAEWYSGDWELHIIIREQEAVYIKVWGTNIENEMHVDVLNTEDYLDIWDWLLDAR